MGVFNSSWNTGMERYHIVGGFPGAIPDTVGMWQSPGVVTIASSAVETALLTGTPAIGYLTIPANYAAAGTCLRVILRGYIQTAAVVPTAQVRITMGGTQIYTTGAIAFGGAQISPAVAFEADYEIGFRSIGATGTVSASGVFWTNSLTSASLSPASDQTGTINTTAANALSILWTWGTSDPANSISVVSSQVEIIG